MLYPHSRELCPYTFVGGHQTASRFDREIVENDEYPEREFFHYKHQWYACGQTYGHHICGWLDYIMDNRLTGFLSYNTWSQELDADGSPRVDVNAVEFRKGRIIRDTVEVVD